METSIMETSINPFINPASHPRDISLISRRTGKAVTPKIPAEILVSDMPFLNKAQLISKTHGFKGVVSLICYLALLLLGIVEKVGVNVREPTEDQSCKELKNISIEDHIKFLEQKQDDLQNEELSDEYSTLLEIRGEALYGVKIKEFKSELSQLGSDIGCIEQYKDKLEIAKQYQSVSILCKAEEQYNQDLSDLISRAGDLLQEKIFSCVSEHLVIHENEIKRKSDTELAEFINRIDERIKELNKIDQKYDAMRQQRIGLLEERKKMAAKNLFGETKWEKEASNVEKSDNIYDMFLFYKKVREEYGRLDRILYNPQVLQKRLELLNKIQEKQEKKVNDRCDLCKKNAVQLSQQLEQAQKEYKEKKSKSETASTQVDIINERCNANIVKEQQRIIKYNKLIADSKEKIERREKFNQDSLGIENDYNKKIHDLNLKLNDINYETKRVLKRTGNGLLGVEFVQEQVERTLSEKEELQKSEITKQLDNLRNEKEQSLQKIGNNKEIIENSVVLNKKVRKFNENIKIKNKQLRELISKRDLLKREGEEKIQQLKKEVELAEQSLNNLVEKKQDVFGSYAEALVVQKCFEEFKSNLDRETEYSLSNSLNSNKQSVLEEMGKDLDISKEELEQYYPQTIN